MVVFASLEHKKAVTAGLCLALELCKVTFWLEINTNSKDPDPTILTKQRLCATAHNLVSDINSNIMGL